MATSLQRLRERSGIFLAVVIFVALAAFVLGDLIQSGGSLMRGQQLRIAEIDGENIEYPEFQARFEQVSDVYKSNNGVNNLTEEAYQQVLNQTWEMMVQEKIMGGVYENLGISVSSDEVFDLVQGNNLHPIIRQLFANQQTGQVDKANIIRFLKYIQTEPAPNTQEWEAWNNQYTYWLKVEDQIMSSTKQSKYVALVSNALYANSLQAKCSLQEKNREASLKFIQKKITDVSDEDVSVSDSDLKAFYNNNIKQFKNNAQCNIVYTAINIEPSEEDDASALAAITELKSDFEKASDNAQFVNANADTRFEDVYNSKVELVEPIASWAFAAQVGEVYGPYKDGETYKLVKLSDSKMLPDSVKASHILIRVQNMSELAAANATIDSLKKAIEDKTVSFEQAAKDNSQDGSASEGGDLGWFKKGAMVPAFENAAFGAAKNELVVVQTQFGVHLIKVIEQGVKSQKVQLAILDREVIPSTATTQKIYSQASQLAMKSEDLNGLEVQLEEQDLLRRDAVVGENDRSIVGLKGAARPIIRAAYTDTKPGELIVGSDKSPVFEMDGCFVIAGLVSKTEEGTRSFESVKTAINVNVLQEKKIEYLQKQFNDAKGATIEATAAALSLPVDSASGFNFAHGSVNKIGYEPSINGAASVLAVNQQSAPIAGRRSVCIIELTNIIGEAATDTAAVSAEKEELFNSSSYRASYQAYRTLRDNAEIDDRRSKFY